jgi:hypothetical protein
MKVMCYPLLPHYARAGILLGFCMLRIKVAQTFWHKNRIKKTLYSPELSNIDYI